MNINIEGLINMGPIGLIPLVVIFLSFGMNNFNAQSVEIKLMTNIKKYSIFLYYLLFVSIVVAILLEISLFITKGIDFSKPVEIVSSSFAALIVALGISLITFITMFTVIKLMGYKNNFYIRDDNIDQSKWYIIRRVDSNRILLSNNNNSYRFIQIDDLKDKIITREVVQLKGVASMLEKVIHEKRNTMYIVCSLLALISIFLIELVDTGVWNYIGYSILFIDIVLFVVIMTIITDVKEINDNQ